MYTQWHSWTEDDWSCSIRDRDSWLSLRKQGKDGSPLHSPPALLQPPEMHMCLEDGGAHSAVCVFVYVDLKRQNRHACVRCSWIQRPCAPLLLFLLILYFLLFFFFLLLLFSNFIWVFWFLRTEIILIAVPIVSFLSSLILLTFWLICPSLHLPFPFSLCLLWLWEKLELKSSSLAVTELSCQNCVVY